MQDHIFPHSRGGLSKKENLVCLAEAVSRFTSATWQLWGTHIGFQSGELR
jgi:hypothetical protein